MKSQASAFGQAAKSNAAFANKSDPVATLHNLARLHLIDIEGHKGRANKDEMGERRDELYRIVEEMQPMTVRQVFYQATVRGIVDKNEKSYAKVQQVLAKMRRDETLPFEWIVDNTRDRNHPFTFDSVEDALAYTARHYRKSLWKDAGVYVEIWLEKDALAGVIEDITSKYDVSLMVARGYSSLSFLHEAAEEIDLKDCPVYIYHLGDYDPSGVNAGEKIEEDLQEFAPMADITFERIAVTEEQIEEWDLPTRPTKQSDSRAKNFDSNTSVELDAIEPRRLRKLVEDVIKRHLKPKRYKELLAEEEKERTLIDDVAIRFVAFGPHLTVPESDPDKGDGH